MMYGYGWNYGMPHLIGIIFWVIVIAVAIALMKKYVFTGGGGCCSGHMHDRSMDILRERYAKGEINKHEFEEKKKDLQV